MRGVDLIDKMTTFARIVESGSIVAAARQLRVSPAAVSRQLTRLEAEMGAPLALRTTRRLSVTDLGRQYYERCLRILREVEEAQALGRTHRAIAGPLAVTAPVTFGLARIAPFIPALLAKHRGLRIDLRLEDHVVDLVSEGVDVAVRAGLPTPDSDVLVAHVLGSYERVLVASPAYLRRAGEPRDPGALSRYDTLVHLPGTGVLGSWLFQKEGQEVTVTTAPIFRSNTLYAIREAAIRGAGITLLPDWLVADEIARRRLKRLLPDWRTLPVTVSAIHRVELRGAPRVRAFIEHLRHAYARGGGGQRLDS